MSRKKGNEHLHLMMEMRANFVDPLIGAFGGFLFVFLIAILSMQPRLVSDGPAIATKRLPPALHNSAYEIMLAAREGLGSYRWTVKDGALPAGLKLKEDGTLSGWPMLSEHDGNDRTYTFKLQLTSPRMQEALPNIKPFELVVKRPVKGEDRSLESVRVLTNSPLPPAAPGHPYGLRLAATGGIPPYTWTLADGRLPAGIELNSDGTLEGTASLADANSYKFSVRMKDSQPATAKNREAVKSFILDVLSLQPIRPLVVLTDKLPEATSGWNYNASLVAEGGVPPLKWSATGLPKGISMDPKGRSLTGNPVEEGSSDISLEVTDSVGAHAKLESVNLKVHPPAARIILFGYYLVGLLKVHGVFLIMLLAAAFCFGSFGAVDARAARGQGLKTMAKCCGVLTVVCSCGSLLIEWMGWEERFAGFGVLLFFVLYFVPFVATPVVGYFLIRRDRSPGFQQSAGFCVLVFIGVLVVRLIALTFKSMF